MKQIYKNLFAGFLTLSLCLPLTAQFQNLYVTNSETEAGDMRRVATVNRDNGDPVEYCIVGADFDANPIEGTIAWIDEQGDPILFRRITPRTCNGTNIFGRDVCEASFDGNITLAAFYEDGPCPNLGFPRTTLVYFDEAARGRVNTRGVSDFEVQAMISTQTSHPSAEVFMVGNQVSNGNVMIHASDAAGNTVWSISTPILDFSTQNQVSAIATDLVFDPIRQELVVTGSLEQVAGNEVLFILVLDPFGALVNFAYHELPSGDHLVGNTIAIADAGRSEVVIGGGWRKGNGPTRPAFLSFDLANIFFPLDELYLNAPTGMNQANFLVEDLASDGSTILVAVGTIIDNTDRGFSMNVFAPTGVPLGHGPLLTHDAGAYVSVDNTIHGVTFNPHLDVFPAVGAYETADGIPWTDSHWALGLSNAANSACDNAFPIDPVTINSFPLFPAWLPQTFGNMSGVNIRQPGRNNNFAPQCVVSKFSALEEEVSGKEQATVTWTDEKLSVEIADLSEVQASLTLSDLNGRQLWTGKTTQGKAVISTSDFPTGVIFLTWETPSGQWGTKKVALIR